MSLRKLQHFVTLIDVGNFAKASEELHLSQPALTRSMQSLEAQLGCQLIDRSYGRTRLTSQGTVVLERARRILRENQQMKHDLEAVRSLSYGNIRVGFGAVAASFLLNPVITAVLERHPGWRIEVEVDDSTALSERIKAEELDVFIGDSKSVNSQPQLSIEPLPPIEMGFYVRKTHPLTQRESVSAVDLLSYPVAGPHLPRRITHLFRQRIDELVSRNARELLTVACDQLHDVYNWVLTTDTIGLLPIELGKGESTLGATHRLCVPTFEDMWLAYGAVTLSGRTLSPAAKAFISILHEVVQDHNVGTNRDRRTRTSSLAKN